MLEFGHAPGAPDLGESVVAPAWDPYGREDIPLVVSDTRWSPAMVLSHDCELEKEFNRAAWALIREGIPQHEAIRIASDNPDLDRFVMVAPLLPYVELPEGQHEGVRSGQRIGFLPVPEHPLLEEETFVPLDRICTVERALLVSERQITSLSYLACGVLRYKLSECFTARDLSLLAEIEAMVGASILNIHVEPRNSKTTSLQIFLEGGDVVHLEIRRPRENLVEEIRRLNPFRERA